jgi:hypothetical protein
LEYEKILVYRRTHTGDPDPVTKEFGIHDCMGRVREWEYRSVIGVGGVKPDYGDEGISKRITWVGIGRRPSPRCADLTDIKRMQDSNPNFQGFRAKIISFDEFFLWDAAGPLVKNCCPELYRYMFKEHRIPRAAVGSIPDHIRTELSAFLKKAREGSLPTETKTNAEGPDNKQALSINSKSSCCTGKRS